MILANEFTDTVSTLASIIAAIAALGTFALLYATFGLQAFSSKEQLKVTKAQMKLLEVELIRHREEIKPRFDVERYRKPFHYSFDPEGTFTFDLKFTLNENPTPIFSMRVQEGSKGIDHDYGVNAPYPKGPLNSKTVFVMEFKYKGTDTSDETLKALNLYITFKLNFTDIKRNEYEQVLTYITSIEPNFFVQEPKLLKVVDDK
ncbi:MAG: hypothetical protein JWO06_3875 [Bacteroidota bacterium]|nr:hypothetical protein [Bacteroidota bacterium]